MDAPISRSLHRRLERDPTLPDRLVAILAGLAVLTLGVLVIVGWLTHTRTLTNLHPSLPPMQFNTAIGFICCGIGFICTFKGPKWIIRASGGAALAIGSLTLFEYVTGIDLKIDGLLFDQSPDPNRMAPNTAICFTLVGATLVLISDVRIRDKTFIARAVFSSTIIVLSVAALIGYLFHIETAYGWGRLTRMSVHTSTGFLILGSARLFLTIRGSRRQQSIRSMHWVPWIAAFAISVLSLLMWQALQAGHHSLDLPKGEHSTYSILSWVLLIGGLLLGWLFQITLSRAAIARAEVKERKLVEAQLRETIQELELQKYALDQHSIVAITDPRGVITMVNDQFCEISGYSREELIGRTHRIINSGTHPKEFFVALWKAITSGQTWQGEICNRRKDGSLYWVDTTIVPFKDAEGFTTQYVSIRTDVTKLKKSIEENLATNEELRHKNAEMEQFAYTVSHDLKSPLVTIMGYIGYLKRDIEENRYERTDRFIESISKASEKMRSTIDDLLELSRVGRVAHDPAPYDLNELVAAVINDLKPQIHELGAKVTVASNLPPVHGDRVRIEQVLQNLVANALKYARQDDKKLEIKLSAQPDDDGMVRIEVRDNGPGIPPDFAEKVFGLFERLKSGTEGTGIGLAIVRRIAELHGGHAWVESNPDGGANFIVTFPGLEYNDPSDSSVPLGAQTV